MGNGSPRAVCACIIITTSTTAATLTVIMVDACELKATAGSTVGSGKADLKRHNGAYRQARSFYGRDIITGKENDWHLVDLGADWLMAG